METRKIKLGKSKSGSGSTNFRVGIPAPWLREMGLSETIRGIVLTYDKEKGEIIIKKDKEVE